MVGGYWVQEGKNWLEVHQQALARSAPIYHTPLPSSHTYFEGATTGLGPVAGKASWLTGPFAEASLEPTDISPGKAVMAGLGNVRY